MVFLIGHYFMHLIILLFALFASVFTIGKAALETTEPFFFVGVRMMVAGIILLAFQGAKNYKNIILNKRDLFPILGLSLFNIYLTNMLEFWGLCRLTSFKTCFIYSLSPFMSALISYLVFSEIMTPRKWLGLFIGCIGFIPILYYQDSIDISKERIFLAELAVAGACICNAYGWVILKQTIKENKLSPLTSNGYSMLIGGFFSLAHSYCVENWSPIPSTDYMTFITSTFALIIISNLFCYNLYGYLLKKFSATFISFAGFTTPIFAAFYGWLFLNETIPLAFYVSGVIVFTGLYIFNVEELKTVTTK